jgi:hypothetical protein
MLSSRFKAVAERVVIPALQTSFFALALSGFDQVLQTPRTLGRRFSTFCASSLALFSQLVLSLPRNRQTREFILYRSSHFSISTKSIIVHSFDRSEPSYTQNKLQWCSRQKPWIARALIGELTPGSQSSCANPQQNPIYWCPCAICY